MHRPLQLKSTIVFGMKTAPSSSKTEQRQLGMTMVFWVLAWHCGSDVSGSETCAVEIEKNKWEISGFKWFSSATDSDM